MLLRIGLVPALLVVVLVLFSPVQATAQQQVGVRAGVSVDPGQFYVGGHVQTEPLLENFAFRPNLEVGFGDDLVLIALNVEFAYRIPLPDQPWAVFLGAGPALNIFSFDEGSPKGDDTDTEGGFNILVGLEHNQGFFTEFKVGMSDSPDAKFAVGYSF